jgi:formate dehydrogenase maturation protein FdhE
MSQPSQPYIMDPRTNKKHTISREAHTALVYSQKEAQEKSQKMLAEKIDKLLNLASGKAHKATANNIEGIFKFNKEGRIDMFDPELKIDLKKFRSPEVETVVTELILCINQALEERSKDIREGMKSILPQVENKEEKTEQAA